MSSALDDVRQTAQKVRELRQAGEDYALAVHRALEQGETVRAVAEAGGVTVFAIYRMRDRRWPKLAELGD